jgi:hypothetical protein
MDVFVFNSDIENPFVHTLKSFTPDTILFEGYFHLEDGTMPVERIISKDDSWRHVELYQKKTLNNMTSGESGEDAISFSPVSLIELKYRLITVLNTNNEYNAAKTRINGLEADVIKKNEPLRAERLKREYAEMIEQCKKMDYKSFLKH